MVRNIVNNFFSFSITVICWNYFHFVVFQMWLYIYQIITTRWKIRNSKKASKSFQKSFQIFENLLQGVQSASDWFQMAVPIWMTSQRIFSTLLNPNRTLHPSIHSSTVLKRHSILVTHTNPEKKDEISRRRKWNDWHYSMAIKTLICPLGSINKEKITRTNKKLHGIVLWA